MKCGRGRFIDKLGTTIYDGEWLNNLKDGKGLIKYSNNDTYNGEWCDDKKKG